MTRYYNAEENKVYYEGRSMTRQTDKGLFSGIPTEQQLNDWGYVRQEDRAVELSEEEKAEQVRLGRMAEIQAELAAMDYLTSKEADGEDMSAYNEKFGGDWHEYRRQLRREFNELEGAAE